jgi:hypothetical protein
MGVGHAGCANKAREGKMNVFSMLQKRANAALPPEERKAIIGYWCDNHKLDLVAGDVEDLIPYIGSLLHFLRSIVTHVMGSDRAKGMLDYIALMISLTNVAEVTDDQPMLPEGAKLGDGGSLKSVFFCPQRWIACVKPMSMLVDKMDHFIMYMVFYVVGASSCQVQKRLIAIAFHGYRGAIK